MNIIFRVVVTGAICWLSTGPAGAQGSRHALRFYGTGTGQQDRVRIRIDDTTAGPDMSAPCDVGAGSFTVEFWLRGLLADNTASSSGGDIEMASGTWIDGNIVVDRDIWGDSDADWGISLAGGYVRFGTGRGDEPVGRDTENTIEGNTSVLNGAWHHVAVVRNVSNGVKYIYVDGVEDFRSSPGASDDDISFPNDGVANPVTPWNPYIVLGAEKHDAGSSYPSFKGYFDELRVWNVARASNDIAASFRQVLRPPQPNLVAYYRFEEGYGRRVDDISMAGSPTGQVMIGQVGNGEWVAYASNTNNTAPVQPPEVRWPTIQLTLLASGFTQITDIASAGDGRNRLFVAEKRGHIKIVSNNVIRPTAFLNMASKVSTDSERGLLGIAFPAGFVTGGHFYISYTDLGGTSILSRIQVHSNDIHQANLSSEEQILKVPQPYANHNGGQIAFSPRDGYLYFGLGDGGSGNDPSNRAQNTDSLLGKMLRIQVEPPQGAGYIIPSNNPFVGHSGYREEIWAMGLRNPWRWAFDPLTGDLFIADVGQGAWEEVNVQPSTSPGGENYGWRIYEGEHCTGLDPCNAAGLTFPATEYSHSLGISITGGKVFRGSPNYSYLQGVYLFADFAGWSSLWGLQRVGGNWYATNLVQPGFGISTFGADEAGRLHVADYSNGRLYRINEVFADADADGLHDAWETYYGFQTNTAADASTDADADGMSNLDEFRSGTQPRDAASLLRLEPTHHDSPAGFSVRWQSVTGKTYRIQVANTPLSVFSVLASNLPATPSLNSFTNLPLTADRQIYRIEVEP